MGTLLNINLILSALSLAIFDYGQCANILAIFPFPGASQYIQVQPYLKTLAARGHNVTVISAFPQKNAIPNFRDIPVMEVMKHNEGIFELVTKQRSKWGEEKEYSLFATVVTMDVLANREVQKLLHSTHEHFDLVIAETYKIDALYAFAHHFKAPLIGVSSFGADSYNDILVDNTSPMAYVPSLTSTLTENMDFKQRLRNVFDTLLEVLLWHLHHLPTHEKIYKQHFPHTTVPLKDICKNFSLILLNQHFSLSFARPYVPTMIEVGGFHIQHTPQPLPTEIENFINQSPHDVIYFAMGSNVKSKDLPEALREVLLKTFASLPYRVLWKFEAEDLPGKPDNVLIRKWFPQSDVLAHPRVKLFITHGGLLSTMEAIYYGKPILGIPIFDDQFMNIKRATQAGYCLSMDFRAPNQTEFRGKIQTLLSDERYTRKIRLMSELFRDQETDPLERAVYWTEYVLRHKGAPHLRVAARHLNFLQNQSLDTGLVLFGGPVLAASLIVWLLVKSIRFLSSRKTLKKDKEKQS